MQPKYRTGFDDRTKHRHPYALSTPDSFSVNLDEVDRFVKEMGLAQIEQETSRRVNVSRLPEETNCFIKTKIVRCAVLG